MILQLKRKKMNSIEYMSYLLRDPPHKIKNSIKNLMTTIIISNHNYLIQIINLKMVIMNNNLIKKLWVIIYKKIKKKGKIKCMN